jgi:adenylylsulfate kinase
MAEQAHITWHQHSVSREDRERLNGHRGCILWFTGLSGCGKSTVANVVDHKLHGQGVHSFLLDGDNIRHSLNASPALLVERHGQQFAERFGLGFSAQDREENIRRIGAVAELFCSAGIVTLTAFVSPYRRDRDAVRQQVEAAGQVGDFIEIFVDAPLAVCEQRDPKGLYRKARAGELKQFTGIDDPYEPPETPALVLQSAAKPPEELADEVIAYLRTTGKIADAGNSGE